MPQAHINPNWPFCCYFRLIFFLFFCVIPSLSGCSRSAWERARNDGGGNVERFMWCWKEINLESGGLQRSKHTAPKRAAKNKRNMSDAGWGVWVEDACACVRAVQWGRQMKWPGDKNNLIHIHYLCQNSWFNRSVIRILLIISASIKCIILLVKLYSYFVVGSNSNVIIHSSVLYSRKEISAEVALSRHVPCPPSIWYLKWPENRDSIELIFWVRNVLLSKFPIGFGFHHFALVTSH